MIIRYFTIFAVVLGVLYWLTAPGYTPQKEFPFTKSYGATHVVPIGIPVVVPIPNPDPFVHPDYGPADSIYCKFINTSDREARVMVKITYFIERRAFRNLTPLMRVSRNYITIESKSSKLASFKVASSNMHGTHEVVVLKGEVQYQCGFGG